MEKEMEKEKNRNMKEIIFMVKNGMEEDMIKMVI